MGGGFSESEAFLGKLGLLDVWDVVLEEDNVTELWNSCEKYHGNLVAWAQMRQYIHGDVVVTMRTLKASRRILATIPTKLSDLSQPVLSRLSSTRRALPRQYQCERGSVEGGVLL